MIEFANRANVKKLARAVFAHQPLVVDVACPYLLFGSNRIVGSNLLLLEVSGFVVSRKIHFEQFGNVSPPNPLLGKLSRTVGPVVHQHLFEGEPLEEHEGLVKVEKVIQ